MFRHSAAGRKCLAAESQNEKEDLWQRQELQ